MALTQIVDIAECVAYMGKGSSLSEGELGQLNMIKSLAEKDIRRYLQTGITQQTYTEYLPKSNAYDELQGHSRAGTILRLSHFPLRTVTSINEQVDAYSEQASGAFGASSALTEGEDFYRELDTTNFGLAANLIRLGNEWPVKQGSIKVVYVAGWTSDELDGDVTDAMLDASEIKHATLVTVAEAFNQMLAQQADSGAAGTIKSERLGDYAVTYDTVGAGIRVDIPEEAKKRLDHFRRAPMF